MNPTTQSIVLIALGLIICVLAGWCIHLERRLRKLVAGKNGMSLETSIRAALTDVTELRKTQDEMLRYCEQVEKRLRRTISGVDITRFDAFSGGGSGGRQSFAMALVSEDGDGVIVSSLFARDRMSVFAKPVAKLTSAFELSQEEQDALTNAHFSCKVEK